MLQQNRLWPVALGAAGLVALSSSACSSSSTPAPGTPVYLVYHTASGVFATPLSSPMVGGASPASGGLQTVKTSYDWGDGDEQPGADGGDTPDRPDNGDDADDEDGHVKTSYPAACYDTDDDHDGVPDSLERDDEGSGDDQSRDFSSDKDGQDGDGRCYADNDKSPDAGVKEKHRCMRCHMPPGKDDDYHVKVGDDDSVRLARGWVYSRMGNRVSISSKDGMLSVDLAGAWVDGTVSPGAEVEVEGVIDRAHEGDPDDGEGHACKHHVKGTHVHVHCPGPIKVPDGGVPPGTPTPPAPGADGGTAGSPGGNPGAPGGGDAGSPAPGCFQPGTACAATSQCCSGAVCTMGMCVTPLN